jgi:hypothetical protein
VEGNGGDLVLHTGSDTPQKQTHTRILGTVAAPPPKHTHILGTGTVSVTYTHFRYRYWPHIFLEGLRKTQNTRSQDYCQDTNPRLSGYKAGVLFTYSTVAFSCTLSHSRPLYELSPSLRNSRFILFLLLDSINGSLLIVILFFL